MSEAKVNEILFKISESLDVPVQFVDGDDQKLHPSFEMDGIYSKLVGLLVYAGVNVSPHIAPTYHRVHADVDYWRHKFELESSGPQALKEAVALNNKEAVPEGAPDGVPKP